MFKVKQSSWTAWPWRDRNVKCQELSTQQHNVTTQLSTKQHNVTTQLSTQQHNVTTQKNKSSAISLWEPQILHILLHCNLLQILEALQIFTYDNNVCTVRNLHCHRRLTCYCALLYILQPAKTGIHMQWSDLQENHWDWNCKKCVQSGNHQEKGLAAETSLWQDMRFGW